jgi:hypothetical protein
VNVRVKISALWTSMLFIFAYVDLFSLYRRDFRANLEAGEVAGFALNQTFLLGTTAYVVIPSLMVFCVLVVWPRLNRIINIVLAALYLVSIVAATIGEWSYYVLSSLIESAPPRGRCLLRVEMAEGERADRMSRSAATCAVSHWMWELVLRTSSDVSWSLRELFQGRQGSG